MFNYQWLLLLSLFFLCHAFTNYQQKPNRNLPGWSALFCQLLGMNCATPTDFCFSFKGFCRRGGDTDIHDSGWGMAFYNGQGLRQFHDTEAAATSEIASFLGNISIQTLNMMAHIRFATHGEVKLANVHPFSREMWGINWVFSHNGDIPMFKVDDSLPWIGEDITNKKQSYFPVGDTDSEALFCAILNALKEKFITLPSLPILHGTLQDLLNEVVQSSPQSTILNCLISCGPHNLFAYSWPGSRDGSNVWNGLHYTVREYPFGKCRLQDLDYEIDFAKVTSRDDRVAIIATKPLTEDEEWIELTKGELILFDEGIPHRSPASCVQVEMHGHGLQSRVLEHLPLEEDLRRYRFKSSYYEGGAGI